MKNKLLFLSLFIFLLQFVSLVEISSAEDETFSIVKIEKDSEDFDFVSESLKEKLEYGYNVLELVRPFKPLGTAILKLIYQNLITAEKIGLDNSFDHAINANIIPQLETIPKPTLKILYEYLFGDVVDFLNEETQKEQYRVGLESILSYMEYDIEKDIQSYMKGFLTGTVPNMKAEIKSMKESHEIEFDKSSIFKKSLDKILKQSEF